MEPLGLLTEQLSALTSTLDDPGTDLKTMLDVLSAELTAAVPSYLGFTLTLHLDDGPVTLTTADRNLARAAQARIAFPLATAPSEDLAGTLVCYARDPGSFVALVAETRLFYGSDTQILLDDQLPGTAPVPAGIAGLDNHMVINRAIGVLISRGHSPAQAHTELLRRAAAGGFTVPTVAAQVLSGTNAP
jgi:hypothetical protein